jgi:hypothetical protein
MWGNYLRRGYVVLVHVYLGNRGGKMDSIPYGQIENIAKRCVRMKAFEKCAGECMMCAFEIRKYLQEPDATVLMLNLLMKFEKEQEEIQQAKIRGRWIIGIIIAIILVLRWCYVMKI